MKTVHEVSELTGVSVRTLRYYDEIGLLHPSKRTEAGYRLYTDSDLERLGQILLFRELQFSLKEIKDIMTRPDYNKTKALEKQIELLTLKKDHIENLITLARGIKMIGVNAVDFNAYGTRKIDDYFASAKGSWGNTPQFMEFEQKDKGRTEQEQELLIKDMMSIFGEFAELKDGSADSEEAQALVVKLQNFITDNFYTCTDKILSFLGRMYGGGGDFTDSINNECGSGTAEFAARAIKLYCE